MMNKAFHSELIQETKTTKGEDIHSKKYEMMFCPNCSGSGQYFFIDRGVSKCTPCEGSGLIQIEKDLWLDENKMFRLLS